MAFSVNTNAGAFAALQNLNKTTAQLNTVQTQINTGLKVASAKDDAATFAI
ncbi:MAG: flagellin, partial [Candidatus Hydrogenedentota bacterium]